MKKKTKSVENVQSETENTTGEGLVKEIETLLDYCFQSGYPQTVQFETNFGKYMVVVVKIQEDTQ